MSTPAPATRGLHGPVLPLAAAAVAGIAHLAVGALYLASGLMAPLWAVVALLVWWGVLGAVLVRCALRRSYWALAVPAVAVASWFAVMTLGDTFLGWTA